MPNTTSVAITLRFDSSAQGPPYNFDALSGTITYDDGTTSSFQGWTDEGLGTPDANGATFTLTVVDSSYATNSTGIMNWAMVFVPRPGTTNMSPFSSNATSLSGSGVASSNGSGSYSLNVGNNKIKNAGTWDWSLLLQVQLSGNINCFASDPEMDVGP